ncbi:MAG: hypothetical protein MI743_14720 [Sneathiellales bacterium]|nr:hypothetical protein [Sneathiellales bacterium]
MGLKEQETPIFFGGVIIGILITGILFLIAADIELQGYLKDYGGFFAGLLGVIAGLITTLVLLWQIYLINQAQKEERTRKLKGVQAILPLIISELHQNSEANLKASLDIIKRQKNKEEIELSLFSQNTLSELKELIIYSNPNEQAHLSEFIREYQLLKSRFEGALEEYSVDPDLATVNYLQAQAKRDTNALYSGHVFSAVTVYLMIDAMFEFARAQTDTFDYSRLHEKVERQVIGWTDKRENWEQTISHIERLLKQRYQE